MNPLLISGFGTSINVEKRKLVIQNRLKNERIEFYPHKIDHDSLVIDGHTGNITFESMRWLMKHGIHITLLNWDGRLLAITLPESPFSGKLRIRQYQKYQDDNTRFQIAEKIVASKIRSSLDLLTKLSQYYDLDVKQIEKLFERERQNYINSQKVGSLTNLLMYEGRVAQVYFTNLGVIFTKIGSKFNYESRKGKENSKNYNASDEINALLNYGYAILESEVRKAVNSCGLDYAIGFLHEMFQGKTPLVYDIQELLRWLVDYSVIQLLEDGLVKKSDFIITENYHTRLKESTAKLLIEKIRANFNRKVPYKEKNYAYQNILFANIQQLANYISDKRKNLEFVVPSFEIKRDDTMTLREKILQMTPDKRKRLGINKSTLWYMKKNITEGKNIKIYDKILSKLKFDY